MNKVAVLAVVMVVPVVGAALAAMPGRSASRAMSMGQPEEMPAMPPPPGEHHRWLDRLVGTWAVESAMGEGEAAVTCTGTDTVRSVGGRWVVSDLRSEVPGMGPFSAVATIGYDAEAGKYQGTWVDSMTDYLWVYEGRLDETRQILTLEAEGPNMMDPGKGKVRYRDVIEFKSADHRTLTSSAFMDGEWVEFATADYRRTE